MANETRGILFETIAEMALQEAVKLAKIPGIVRWNERPEGMSINPDFTIGVENDSPSHVILVTASGSAKETDKKFWRNIGELQEVHAQLPTLPRVVNLYFKSVIKKNLVLVSEAVCDATLHVDSCHYHAELTQWAGQKISKQAAKKEAKQALLENAVNTNPKFKSAIASLAQDLAQALKQKNTDLDPLWALMREDYAKPHHPPTAKPTSVRRGLGKLLVLEPQIRTLVCSKYKERSGIPLNQMPEYAYELGFFRKSLLGACVDDPEIKGALELLGGQTCDAVLQQAPPSMMTWINPLKDLRRIATHVDFIHDHHNQIIDPDGLKTLMVQSFRDPAGLSGEAGDEKVWVYEIMISLLKAKSGKLQGYGLAQLAVDTGVPEFGAGGFIIPPFIQREKMLSDEHLEKLSIGLSQRFQANVFPSDFLSLKSQVKRWVIKENLEDRLIPYRNFEPLMWLLTTELEKQGKSYEPKQTYVGWINEYTDVGKRSATTPFVKVGSTLIHWKSSYKSHPNDKTKELSARARSVKYQYHPESQTFSRRSGVSQLALILDGDWKDQHLQTLSASGWDIIVYPDEIASLVSQL